MEREAFFLLEHTYICIHIYLYIHIYTILFYLLYTYICLLLLYLLACKSQWASPEIIFGVYKEKCLKNKKELSLFMSLENSIKTAFF